MNTTNNTHIETESFIVIRTKQQLQKFLDEQKEHLEKYKGQYPKIEQYHTGRIAELKSIIKANS